MAPQQDFRDTRNSDWDGNDRRVPMDNPQRGVKFDATINLGHMLTFLGFIVAIFTSWATLDKRVTVIEERATLQAVVDRNQDGMLTTNMLQIKESLTEIKSQVNRIAERTDRRSAP